MTRVLVTGASGFIGRALCHMFASSGVQVRAAVRRPESSPAPREQSATGQGAVEKTVVGDLGPATDWTEALRGVEVVVHLAARVHVLRETAADPLEAFRVPNVLGTEHLARSCSEAGVRRLVYLSSVKVHGESTHGRAFTEADPPAPEDAYAKSKAESERVLWDISGDTGLEAVVIRPCLVYGPGVGGNVRLLLRVLSRGIPLPLASVHNRRSLIGLENLCDLLARCVDHEAAVGETFLASDGLDLSTPELIRGLSAGLGRPARLVPVPLPLLQLAAGLTGLAAALQRLCGSLQVDSSKARRVLAWSPPVSPQLGLRSTAEWYRRASA